MAAVAKIAVRPGRAVDALPRVPGARCGMILLALLGWALHPALPAAEDAPARLWSRGNLHAWCVVAYDAKRRRPDERARMLQDLGFTKFVYDWRDKDVPDFDAEIEALKERGIALLGWWCPPTANDPKTRLILEACRRHDVHPQLWVRGGGTPTASAAEQEQRIRQETERIRALAAFAAPYGCTVELYNHNGWFGQEDNQLAIIDRLAAMGIADVGMVYNFAQAHDNLHDDTVIFPEVWSRIRSRVVAVNITGVAVDALYSPRSPAHRMFIPSQGERELGMMRVIQDSGWHGSIGLIAEKNGESDAASTLTDYLTGFDWLVAELRKPGSGGPRPSF